MTMTTMNFKADEEIKEQAQKIFKEMAMNTTTAFNMFLVKTIQERQLPFHLTAIRKTESDWDELSPIIQEKKDFAIADLRAGAGYSVQDLEENKERL